MEIKILYSKDTAGSQKAASFVKEAVKNLGISARITEQQTGMSIPRVVVDGFDLLNNFIEKGAGTQIDFSYEAIEKALERSAWSG
jgi:hypothetical protein